MSLSHSLVQSGETIFSLQVIPMQDSSSGLTMEYRKFEIYLTQSSKHLKSFEELIADYNIPRNQLFSFLQLRNFIRSQQGQSLSIPLLSKGEKVMCTDNLGQGIISKIYNLLVA